MKLLVFLLVLFFLFVASPVGSQELYRWVDETGKLHIVDDVKKVPEKYREGTRAYRSSSGLRETSPIRKNEVSEPTSKTEEKKEETKKSTLTPEERAARARALRQREKELEEERHRQRVLQRRFGAARATFYEKRVEALDQELDVIQKELDALRPEDQ